VITTPELIEALAANARPVRRLRHPAWRAAGWLLLAAITVGLIAVGHGVRADIGERLREPVFAIALAAAAFTGIFAALAAFMISLPDRSRAWLVLPAPALVVWLATIGYGCLIDWVAIGPAGIELGETARCFATLFLTSFPLSLTLLLMLRHAAVLRPTETAVTGALAVAAIAATALSLIHDLDATVMILVWNVATTAVFVALGAAYGQRLLSWVAPRPLPLAA
jgi:hypothetical protein